MRTQLEKTGVLGAGQVKKGGGGVLCADPTRKKGVLGAGQVKKGGLYHGTFLYWTYECPGPAFYAILTFIEMNIFFGGRGVFLLKRKKISFRVFFAFMIFSNSFRIRQIWCYVFFTFYAISNIFRIHFFHVFFTLYAISKFLGQKLIIIIIIIELKKLEHHKSILPF